MIKNIFSTGALLLLLLNNGFSQDSFKKALDDFHYVLAFTYHPMVDDSNYAPIRERSAKLYEAAEEIENELENSDVGSGLALSVETLVEQCKALDDVIKKNAANDVIEPRLQSIHTQFHDLEELHNKLVEEE